jgi:hypothetical protein
MEKTNIKNVELIKIVTAITNKDILTNKIQ